MGAQTYVEARKYADLAMIEGHGYEPLPLDNLKDHIHEFDIIFNTIPSLILDDEILTKVKKDALIIDLASKPGGIDFEYQLPKKKLNKETLIKYYDLIRPTRCVIEESQRYLRLEHEDKESYVSYFTVNAIVGELDFPSVKSSISSNSNSHSPLILL